MQEKSTILQQFALVAGRVQSFMLAKNAESEFLNFGQN